MTAPARGGSLAHPEPGALRVARARGPSADWDALVRADRRHTHFHLSAWLDLHARIFGHEVVRLEARDGAGALHGVLPLVFVRSAVFGRYLVSMPYVNYGGPLGSDAAVAALAAAAVDLAAADGCRLLELRSRGPLPLDLTVSHRKVTVVLDLPARDPEALFKSFPAKLRSQVRRPEKEGLTVRFGPELVPDFHRVLARHMRDLGTPVHGERFFREMVAAFGDTAWVAVVHAGEVPVAAGLAFRWADEVEITWASSLREWNRASPNMLLYWALMRRACEEGLALFNFGRCTPGAGTHKFKRQWGSRDEPLHWYQWTPDGTGRTPSPDDAKYAWGPRLWQRLPVPVATWLGPRVVRGIP